MVRTCADTALFGLEMNGMRKTAIVLLMAGDSQRWWPVFADRRREQPMITVLAVIAPLIGILAGALVTVSMW